MYPNLTIERLNQLNRPLLALSNLHRIVLTELPLLASPNPKLWLIALVLAEETEGAEIVLVWGERLLEAKTVAEIWGG